MFKNKKLKEEAIIDRWSILIGDGAGRGDEIFKKTEQILKEIEAPKIKIARKNVSPSLMKKLRGETRTFLVVSSTYLQGYLMYVGAMDYGKQLFVSWYLTLEPSGIRQVLANLPRWLQFFFLPIGIFIIIYDKLSKKTVSPDNMDVFDLEELSAYVAVVHRAVIDATDEVSQSAGFDFTKANQASKGFLNISYN